MITSLISFLLGLILMALSPFFWSVEQWIMAFFQGRRRSVRFLLVPYLDLWKLIRIQPTRPATSSWLFAFTPPLLLVINAILIFALPGGTIRPLLILDPILLVYLLALHRFLFSLAGLDGGTPFGGLGGARTMYLNFVSEINFLLWIVALTLFWQPRGTNTDLASLVHAHLSLGWRLLLQPALILLGIVLAILILYELERIPLGDPSSHLELTMNEKAMTLGWQGRDLAWIKFSDMLRLSFFIILFVDLFLPAWGSHDSTVANMDVLLLLLKALLAILIMGVFTSTRAKLRQTRLAGPAFFAGALSLLSIVVTISFHLYLPK